MRKLLNSINFLQKRAFCEKKKINFTYKYLKDNSIVKVSAIEGESLLKVAHNHNINIEGACDSSLSCSTCHLILNKEIFNKLSKPTEDELDLLDLVFCSRETSRLGCQVKVNSDFEGTEIQIPETTVNLESNKDKKN
jgi:ferredoxin